MAEEWGVVSRVMMFLFAVLLSVCSSGVSATVFTLQNRCPYTVWPGTLSGNGAAVLGGGGFALLPNAAVALEAPPGWSGRFWARTGCVFDPSGANGRCTTGDCGGGVRCTGGGAPPVSLAEFTLGATRTSTRCPAELRVAGDVGQTVACRSACDAFGAAEYCCTGAHASPATCGPTRYSQMFKSVCPTAYSYAYDDASSTCTCPAGGDYAITFCPGSGAAGVPPHRRGA